MLKKIVFILNGYFLTLKSSGRNVNQLEYTCKSQLITMFGMCYTWEVRVVLNFNFSYLLFWKL